MSEPRSAGVRRNVFPALVVVLVVALLLWMWRILSSNPDAADQTVGEIIRVPALLKSHIRLTLASLLSAIAISVPVGIVASRWNLAQKIALAFAGIIQTIPSLALLAFMVPLLSGAGLPGIGFLPAFLGLTAYCVLPILLNTVTGLAEVDRALIEAADGVGMTPFQRLSRVELPLALPVIGGGVRTATVWCVGMATLSTPVGAPSLGNLIFAGLQTRNELKVLVGCVAAAVLAQVLDRAVQSLALGAQRRSRPHLVLGLLLVGGVGGFGALPSFSTSPLFADRADHRADLPTLTVGAKSFSEGLILGEIAGKLMEAEGTARYSMRPALGSVVVFDALSAGEIDLTIDYTGTILATVMKVSGRGLTRTEVDRRVRRFLAEEKRVEVIAALGFENSYTLAMLEPSAAALSISSIGDLASHAAELSIGSDYEFFEREEWQDLRDGYELNFADEIPMDASLMYEALESASVDVISAYSTDGRIDGMAMRVLADKRQVFPPYDALLIGRPGLCQEYPAVCKSLSMLEGTIDAEQMRALNRAVDQEHKSPRGVASEFVHSLVGPR